jgi:hypothetical protein
VEVFDFGVGEMNPYVPVPLALRQAIAAAQLAESHSHYTAAPGTPHARTRRTHAHMHTLHA